MAAVKHVHGGQAQQQGGELAARIILAETNQLKVTGGRVTGILISDAGTFDLIFYDDINSDDNQLFDVDSSVWTVGWHAVNVPFEDGIRVVSSGTPGDIVVVYS